MKYLRWPIIIGVLLGGCVTLEIIAGKRLDPTGRGETMSQYLAWRPGGQWFSVLDVDGKQHVIAFGPSRSWVGLASGPSGYVFDDTGRLVDWSEDIGDDRAFDEKWFAQRLKGANSVTRTAVSAIAATQPVK